jgi:hypothetical protein
VKVLPAFKENKVHPTEEPLENLCSFDKDQHWHHSLV